MPKKSTTKNTKPATSTSVKKETKKPVAKPAATKPAPKEKVKAAAKTVKKATKKVVKPEAVKPAAATPDKKSRSFRIRKTYLIAIAAFIVLGALLYIFRSLFVAAVVNGQPISRVAVIRETEKQAGAQALNTLVRNALIEQEAGKQKVTVTDKEVNDEIKKVESNLTAQKQSLDEVLKTQNLTRSDLKNLIRLDKLVQKMVGKDIKVSDKDVDAYIEKNKDLLPKDEDEKKVRQDVKERLQQQQLSGKVQAWLQDLQSKAKVVQFVSY